MELLAFQERKAKEECKDLQVKMEVQARRVVKGPKGAEEILVLQAIGEIRANKDQWDLEGSLVT